MGALALPIPIPIPKIPNPLGGGGLGAGQVIKWIGQGITKAIDAFFGDLVKAALDPLLKLLGQTLLTTPDPSTLPRIGQLWENSRQIAVAVYALLILAAGILVMAYQTVQTRHSIKEIAPRIVVGFITANLSLLFAGKMIAFANALSTGVLGQGTNPKTAAATMTSLVMNAVTNGGIFLVFIGIALACVLLALLVGYVIRVALTVILIAGAPLALMCHALPQTEGIARWWWRAFAGVLAIQLVQSLTLVAALNVFLGPGGFSFFGPTRTGLVNLIVSFALFYILFKIPFWILNTVQVGNGRSFVGGVIKGLIAYKTLGALGLRGPSRSVAKQQVGGASGRGWGGAGGTARPGRRPPGPSGGGGPRRQPRPHPDRGGGAGTAGSTAGAQSRQRQPLASRAPSVRTATRPARGPQHQPGHASHLAEIPASPVAPVQRRYPISPLAAARSARPNAADPVRARTPAPAARKTDQLRPRPDLPRTHPTTAQRTRARPSPPPTSAPTTQPTRPPHPSRPAPSGGGTSR